MWKTSSRRIRRKTVARLLVRDDVAVDREARGGDLLGEVEEGEQRRIALVLDAQVVEPALAGGEPPRLERAAFAAEGGEQRASARAEQLGVVALVERVAQEQPAQERIAR